MANDISIVIQLEVPDFDDDWSYPWVMFELKCSARGYPATGPTYGCGGEPPEGPEFEIVCLSIKHEGQEVYRVSDFKSAQNIFGSEIMTRAFESACQKAADTGEFG